MYHPHISDHFLETSVISGDTIQATYPLFYKPSYVKIKNTVCDPPVPPLGDAHRLDDEDHHLAEKHKEEEEEAEGAVSPKNEKTKHVKILHSGKYYQNITVNFKTQVITYLLMNSLA